MPTLNEIGLKYRTDKAYAHHYCDFYEQNLPDRSFAGKLLEIGIKDGASLKMWQEYYPHAEIHGIDTATIPHIPGCKTYQLDQCDVVGMQLMLPMFDIIIDDGSHMTLHQQISFDFLWENKLSSNGLYVMEDLHTSFYPSYKNSKFTTVEYLRVLPEHRKRSWCRVPDFSDSYTMIIAKNKFPNEK